LTTSTEIWDGSTTAALIDQYHNNVVLKFMLEKFNFLPYLKSESNSYSIGLPIHGTTEKYTSTSINPMKVQDIESIVPAVVNLVLKPLPFVDNGSFFINLLSFEFFLLIIFYFLALRSILKLRHHNKNIVLVSCSLIYSFIIFFFVSALSETNLGTWIRHRFFFVILILILVTINSTKEICEREIKYH
jgi:hypothetical protein